MINPGEPKYRIIQDEAGGLMAQERKNIRDGDGEDAWVFFMDLEECDSMKEAEIALKQAILRTRKRIAGVYDKDGERID